MQPLPESPAALSMHGQLLHFFGRRFARQQPVNVMRLSDLYFPLVTIGQHGQQANKVNIGKQRFRAGGESYSILKYS